MDQPFQILVIEDNKDDEFVIRRAFQKARIVNPIVCVQDGADGLDYLLRRGAHKDAAHARPGLVLLDLHMPRMSGKEFLKEVQAHDELQGLPVIVLTVSDSTEDILDCYDSGAFGYFRKPLRPDNILDFVTSEKPFEIVLVASGSSDSPA